MKKVDMYTDGACSGNPGPGGFGVILSYNGHQREICGYEENTTNNRMELTAIIAGLSALKETCCVTIYTDSKYSIDCIEKGWALKWKNNNWTRQKNKPALNSDLLDKLLSLTSKHKVNFKWIKGHNGHPQNEKCDKMARSQIKEIVK